MSLMKTLTKMAIGIAVAKGVQHMSNRSKTGDADVARTSTPTRRPGTGGTYTPDRSRMGGILDEIMGAGKTTRTSSRRDAAAGSTGGGLGDLLGSLTGAGTTRSRKTGPTGGIGDLLSGQGGSGSLGSLLGAVLGGGALGGLAGAQSEPEPDPQDEVQAAVLLRAMIMAAKSDGKLDEAEKAALMDAAGEATRAEIDFINRELAAPVDIDSLLLDVPRGMEEKVYMASLMAITLDDPSEVSYMQNLAQALGLDRQEIDALHDHMNAPRL